MSRIDEIRARLDAATPGEWKNTGFGNMIFADNPYGHGDMRIADIRGWGHLTGRGACAFDEDAAAAIQNANAELISHARSDLAYQISEIERLENENPKWIKCSDRLPEYGQEVLAWAIDIDNSTIGNIMIMNFQCHSAISWADISLRSSECFEISHGYEETETYIKNTDGRFFDVFVQTQQEITHWMPLPEPPKEEQP